MPPLTQCQLQETLVALFSWAEFSCADMPKVNSYFCHTPVPGIDFSNSPSMAKQSFAEEANINNIMARYVKTGSFYDQEGTRQPQYGDFSNGDAFEDVQNKIVQAKEDFALLDSDVRELFDNDVSQLLDFMSDPENHDEAIELGIIPDPSKANSDEAGQAESSTIPPSASENDSQNRENDASHSLATEKKPAESP